MNKHKFNIFPKMVEEEFSKLVDDINIYGYDENRPITTYEGKIIDGWNRYKACEQLGVEATYTEFNGTDKEAVLLVLRSNKRRNLSSSQWAAIAVDSDEIIQVIKDDVEAERREKQAKTLSDTLSNKNEESLVQLIEPNQKESAMVQLIEPSQKDNNKLASSKVAEIFNTNRGYISDAQKFRDENPETFAKIRSGELSITQANKDIKKEEKEQRFKEMKVAPFPKGTYRVLYVDPPWRYNDKQDTHKLGGAEKHYPTMSITELCGMELPKMEDNSVLFMWTTSPLLEDSFKIINSWGFKYKTSFVWDKVKHNMGHYNSVRHEMLLICTKGSCTPDFIKLFDSVQSIERSDKHSQKPEKFRDIIDTLYTYGNKIELFARDINKEGWVTWGNQAQ